MKSTTKAIFSLGLISFLTLGGMSQNAFAVETKAVGQSATTTSNPQLKLIQLKSPQLKLTQLKSPQLKLTQLKLTQLKNNFPLYLTTLITICIIL
jgi:hypothetical protein